MAYVVLARKYRPLQFADMVGQEHVTRTLQNAIEHGRVHHAYLFAGGRGLGKTTTARILAKALACEKGPTATPCDQCSQCIAIREGHCIDVLEIDGASNNRVDDVRNLREQVHYLPQSARRKIYIIDEVHMLTTSAFNALLKTLEEPPPHVNFMLATTEPHKLLPTILSRVSRLDFRRPSVAQLAAYLGSIVERENLRMDTSALRLVARAANGSVRDSLTLLDQVLAFAGTSVVSDAEVRQILGLADSSQVIELVDAILDRDPARVLTRFDSLVAAGYDLSVLAGQVLELLRDLVVFSVVGSHESLAATTESETERLQQLADKAAPTVLRQLFDRFCRVVDGLSTSRVPWINLEMGLLDLAHAEPLQPIGELIERLETLASEGEAPKSPGTPSRGSGSGGSRERRADVSTASLPSSQSPPRAGASDPTREDPQAGGPISGRLMDMARERGLIGSPTGGQSPDVVKVPETSLQTAAAEDLCEPCLPAGREPPTPIPWAELDPFSAWEQLVGRIRGHDELLAAVLVDVGLVSFRDGCIRIAATPGSFGHQALRPEMRANLEQAIREHLGTAWQVDLLEQDPVLAEAPSVALVEAERRAQRQTEAESQARSHGAIRRLLETFDATLTAVKPMD